MINRWCLSLVVVFLVTMARAGDEPAKVDVRGLATKVTPAAKGAPGGVLGSVLIEGAKDKSTTFDKAVVRITKDTKIEKLVGKERKAASFEDLKQGARVEANFTGPVAESYPVQATAKNLLILE